MMILITASFTLRVKSRIVVHDDPSVVVGLVISVCSGSLITPTSSFTRTRSPARLQPASHVMRPCSVSPRTLAGLTRRTPLAGRRNGFMCARGASTRRTGAGTYVRSSHSRVDFRRLLPLRVFLVVTRFHAPSPRACFPSEAPAFLLRFTA